MKPSVIHTVFAHPIAISWTIGALALNIAILMFISGEVSLTTIFSDSWSAALLVVALIPTSFIGYFVGMFTIWPLVRVACTRINGGPLEEGDRVCILAGPHRGTIATVKKRIIGQGGWKLAMLDYLDKHLDISGDIVEEYSTLKLKNK